MSCLLQNGHAFIFLREIITFGAQSFHLAVEIQSMMQTMQVCLINTRTVCVEKKCPWENVITRTHSWIHQPPVKNGPTDGFMDKAGAEWSRF